MTTKRQAAKPAAAKPASARRNGSATTKAASKTSKPATATTKPASRNGQAHEPEQEPVRKTFLKPAELEEFRNLLLAKRRELIGDMTTMRKEALGGYNGGPSSTMPIHMADLGSDTWEQELTLGLIENERTLLREINEALDRIENKTYGICVATNKPISKARLRAKPWAKHCIEYARELERRRY